MAELTDGINGNYLTNVPATIATTAPSIQLYVTFPGNSRKLIGAIMSFDKTTSRNMTRRVSLTSEIPGQTVEIIPGALNSLSLTIKRAMLNRASIMEELGYADIEDLIIANTPLTIEEVRYIRVAKGQPDPIAGGTAPGDKYYNKVITYNSCYLKSAPMSVNVDGDWIVMQDCEIEVANVVVTVKAADGEIEGVEGGATTINPAGV